MLKKTQFKRALASSGKNLTDNFLIELAKREEPNKSGKMTVNNKFIFVFKKLFINLNYFQRQSYT